MESIQSEPTQTGENQFDQNVEELDGANTKSSTVACTGDCSSASCGGSRACD